MFNLDAQTSEFVFLDDYGLIKCGVCSLTEVYEGWCQMSKV